MKHHTRASILSITVFLVSVMIFAAIFGTFAFILNQAQQKLTPPTDALSGDIAWPAFNGGGAVQGNNSSENVLNSSNVGSLTQLWSYTLPIKADTSLVEQPNVSTSQGTVDLVFVNTVKGNLVALNADTGAKVWEVDADATNYNGQGTKSAPAVDPSGNYIYAYALDGYVHKYNITNGAEITGGGWPEQVTLLPNDTEKGSSSLNIGGGYLYMTTSGNDGDYGHYVGHVVAINLSTGAKTVWNAECANITQLQTDQSGQANYCSNTMSGIWARPGVTIDPITGNIFVATGNGNYNASGGGNNWGDSIVELKPNLSSIVDSYTPTTYATLDSDDADLGSTAPVILPTQAGSNTPYLMVQGGKDDIVRLLNRSDLSGQGGPRHTGGELQKITISNQILSQPAVWVDGSGNTWVFVTDQSGDLYVYKVVTTAGVTTLSQVYRKAGLGPKTSPFVANGVLYLDGGSILAIDATTGTTLFNSSTLGITMTQHWQAPIVVNGRLFTSDGAGNHAMALYIPTATGTGDCNSDGHVDVFDLSILLSHYSTAYAACDFNGDNTVNIFDLSILLTHYGT